MYVATYWYCRQAWKPKVRKKEKIVYEKTLNMFVCCVVVNGCSCTVLSTSEATKYVYYYLFLQLKNPWWHSDLAHITWDSVRLLCRCCGVHFLTADFFITNWWQSCDDHISIQTIVFIDRRWFFSMPYTRFDRMKNLHGKLECLVLKKLYF